MQSREEKERIQQLLKEMFSNTPEQNILSVCERNQWNAENCIECLLGNESANNNRCNQGAIPKSKPQNCQPVPKYFNRLICSDDEIIEAIRAGDRVMIVMRGAPGSGKSTLARSFVKQTIVNYNQQFSWNDFICSSDDFFFDANGRYQYRVDKLSEAHAVNKAKVFEKASTGWSPIIVDNTNMQVWEMVPYIKIALQNGYRVHITEPKTPWRINPDELAAKNSHGVNREKIRVMLLKYERATLADIFKFMNVNSNVEPLKRNFPPLTYNVCTRSESNQIFASQEEMQLSILNNIYAAVNISNNNVTYNGASTGLRNHCASTNSKVVEDNNTNKNKPNVKESLLKPIGELAKSSRLSAEPEVKHEILPQRSYFANRNSQVIEAKKPNETVPNVKESLLKPIGERANSSKSSDVPEVKHEILPQRNYFANRNPQVDEGRKPTNENINNPEDPLLKLISGNAHKPESSVLGETKNKILPQRNYFANRNFKVVEDSKTINENPPSSEDLILKPISEQSISSESSSLAEAKNKTVPQTNCFADKSFEVVEDMKPPNENKPNSEDPLLKLISEHSNKSELSILTEGKDKILPQRNFFANRNLQVIEDIKTDESKLSSEDPLLKLIRERSGCSKYRALEETLPKKSNFDSISAQVIEDLKTNENKPNSDDPLLKFISEHAYKPQSSLLVEEKYQILPQRNYFAKKDFLSLEEMETNESKPNSDDPLLKLIRERANCSKSIALEEVKGGSCSQSKYECQADSGSNKHCILVFLRRMCQDSHTSEFKDIFLEWNGNVNKAVDGLLKERVLCLTNILTPEIKVEDANKLHSDNISALLKQQEEIRLKYGDTKKKSAFLNFHLDLGYHLKENFEQGASSAEKKYLSGQPFYNTILDASHGGVDASTQTDILKENYLNYILNGHEMVGIDFDGKLVSQRRATYGSGDKDCEFLSSQDNICNNEFFPRALAKDLYMLCMEAFYNKMKEKGETELKDGNLYKFTPNLKYENLTVKVKYIGDAKLSFQIHGMDKESKINFQTLEVIPLDLSIHLAFLKIVDEYPTTPSRTLLDVLQTQRNSCKETVKLLLEHNSKQDLGLKKNDAQNNGIFIESENYEGPPVSLAEAKRFALTKFEESRNFAAHHCQLKGECYQKAKENIQKGNSGVTVFFSHVANLHKMKTDVYNQIAANTMIDVQNYSKDNPDLLDLHYLHLAEAICCLDIYLDRHISTLRDTAEPHKYVFVITGRGLHSSGGISTIKTNVRNRLKERNLRWNDVNPGLLRVKVFFTSRYSKSM